MIRLTHTTGIEFLINPHYIVRCWEDRDGDTYLQMADGSEYEIKEKPHAVEERIDYLQQHWRDLG